MTNPPPIELFFWPTPNGYKISILLEELGVPYNVNLVNIIEGDQFKTEFLEISPNGRMPAIVDPFGPDDLPITVFESGAIMFYLANKHQKFYPQSERQRTEVNEWLFWQMSGLGPMGGQAIHFSEYSAEKIPYAIQRYVSEYKRLLKVMDGRLKNRQFLTDSYSIADMACLGWVKASEILKVSLEPYEHVSRWFNRLISRPQVQAGLNVAQELHAERERIFTDSTARKNLFDKNGLPSN
ncbi:glutathione S-transferase N-terminal domain-containing protein [Agaribacter flavus]|uniref:Glutathione S-transferase N-terminal domain-containing protein n=1 Tax=Agaribacter flavus TaxID=1902781 RepID=A0ABV7FIA9_9ALTE